MPEQSSSHQNPTWQTPAVWQSNGQVHEEIPLSGVWSTEQLSLREIIGILLKGKWLLIAAFLLVLGATALYTYTRVPEYETSSVIFVGGGQSDTGLESLLMGNSRVKIENEVAFLKSRRLALRVAERLLETETTPSGEPLTILSDSPSKEVVAGRVQRRVKAAPLQKNVDMIRITATSTQPEEAALIANVYADEYQRFNTEMARARASASRRFLEGQRERIQREVQATEQALQQYMEQEGIVALDEESKALVEQISELEAQRDQTRISLGTERAYLKELEDEVNRIRPGLARQIASGYDKEIASIQNQITELELEAQTFYAKHPELRGNERQHPQLYDITLRLQKLRQRLDQLSKAYVEEALAAGGVVQGGENSGGVGAPLAYITQLIRQITEKRIAVSGLETQLRALEKRLKEYEQRFEAIPRKSIQLARLQRAYEASDKLFMFILEKLQESRIAEESEVGNITVVDYATTPGTPVRPQPFRNLLFGGILGLLLGVGLAFGRHYLDHTVHTPEELRRWGTVMGVVPSMDRLVKEEFEGKEKVSIDGREVDTRLITLLNPTSPVAEAYRRLRTNLQFSRVDKPVQVVVVTSAGPGEGKSITSMNLALALAQSGKRTLYLDADLRRPRGHKMLGISRSPGLVDVLFDMATFEPEQFATGIENLYVLPAGTKVPNPAEILGTRRMQEFLGVLRQSFDAIVVDTPPVLAVTDAVLVGVYSDGVLLVVNAGGTDRRQVERAVESLESVNAPLLGLLLNKFNARKAYGYYGYGYGYYDYYYYAYYGEGEGDGTSSRKKRRKRKHRHART